MPLLHRLPFVPNEVPENIKPIDSVFLLQTNWRNIRVSLLCFRLTIYYALLFGKKNSSINIISDENKQITDTLSMVIVNTAGTN